MVCSFYSQIFHETLFDVRIIESDSDDSEAEEGLKAQDSGDKKEVTEEDKIKEKQ